MELPDNYLVHTNEQFRGEAFTGTRSYWCAISVEIVPNCTLHMRLNGSTNNSGLFPGKHISVDGLLVQVDCVGVLNAHIL